jgi:hypothetical protein
MTLSMRYDVCFWVLLSTIFLEKMNRKWGNHVQQ